MKLMMIFGGRISLWEPPSRRFLMPNSVSVQVATLNIYTIEMHIFAEPECNSPDLPCLSSSDAAKSFTLGDISMASVHVELLLHQ